MVIRTLTHVWNTYVSYLITIIYKSWGTIGYLLPSGHSHEPKWVNNRTCSHTQILHNTQESHNLAVTAFN